MITFGPAGIGGLKEAIFNLEKYGEFGLKACEIAFTYGVYIKTKEDAEKIGKRAKELGIKLSIHAPYWINLNSNEKEKVEGSKKRILDCCRVADWLGSKKVVFHCGYYGKMQPEETFQNIKKQILELMDEIKKNKWGVELCPEIMGKKNVFGSIEEISKLVNETHCSFCIDFAHTLARYGTYDMELLEKSFQQEKWHCHFSGIEYGEKGEKHHKLTSEEEIKKLIPLLPKNKEIIIINESPSPVEDSILSIKVYNKSIK